MAGSGQHLAFAIRTGPHKLHAVLQASTRSFTESRALCARVDAEVLSAEIDMKRLSNLNEIQDRVERRRNPNIRCWYCTVRDDLSTSSPRVVNYNHIRRQRDLRARVIEIRDSRRDRSRGNCNGILGFRTSRRKCFAFRLTLRACR
jgi:hypothetical protein